MGKICEVVFYLMCINDLVVNILKLVVCYVELICSVELELIVIISID